MQESPSEIIKVKFYTRNFKKAFSSVQNHTDIRKFNNLKK